MAENAKAISNVIASISRQGGGRGQTTLPKRRTLSNGLTQRNVFSVTPDFLSPNRADDEYLANLSKISNVSIKVL